MVLIRAFADQKFGHFKSVLALDTVDQRGLTVAILDVKIHFRKLLQKPQKVKIFIFDGDVRS